MVPKDKWIQAAREIRRQVEILGWNDKAQPAPAKFFTREPGDLLKGGYRHGHESKSCFFPGAAAALGSGRGHPVLIAGWGTRPQGVPCLINAVGHWTPHKNSSSYAINGATGKVMDNPAQARRFSWESFTMSTAPLGLLFFAKKFTTISFRENKKTSDILTFSRMWECYFPIPDVRE